MPIYSEIQTAFESHLESSAITDEYIEAHQNIMEIPDIRSLLTYVPTYMLWCAKHPNDVTQISNWTLNALAEYGRSKNVDNQYLNFRGRCNEAQVNAVISFLEWCGCNQPFLNKKQLERAIANWKVR